MNQLEGYINFWPEFKKEQRLEEDAICIIYKRRQVIIKQNDKRITFPTYNECKNLIQQEERAWYLGKWRGKLCFAYELDNSQKLEGQLEWVDFNDSRWPNDREAYFIAIKAEHLLNWDKSSTYCGYCGDNNERKIDERAKICPGCGAVVYPKVSPAIIVGIKKEHQILMAHNAGFKEGLYGIIAGFVEQGESLEMAVKREVYEEVGIKVKNIEYCQSRPWDSIDTLMLGFTAEYESGEIQVDGKEILDAGWYDAQHLPSILPNKITIARSIIDELLGLE